MGKEDVGVCPAVHSPGLSPLHLSPGPSLSSFPFSPLTPQVRLYRPPDFCADLAALFDLCKWFLLKQSTLCCPVVALAVSCQDQLIWQSVQGPLSTQNGPPLHLSCRVSRAGFNHTSALACCVPLRTSVSSSEMAVTAARGAWQP